MRMNRHPAVLAVLAGALLFALPVWLSGQVRARMRVTNTLERTITVSTSARIAAAPDEAQISAGVTIEAERARDGQLGAGRHDPGSAYRGRLPRDRGARDCDVVARIRASQIENRRLLFAPTSVGNVLF